MRKRLSVSKRPLLGIECDVGGSEEGKKSGMSSGREKRSEEVEAVLECEGVRSCETVGM
jgi:hypothetical protein